MNQKFTLTKECWDLVSLERIEMACDISKTAELGAVVMQLGLAHLCLIKSHMTVIKARVEMNIAKKRTGSTAHGKCVIKFYESVMQAIKRHFDFSLLKCVILASPGFVKEDFHKYLMEQAVRQDDKLLLENKSKFLLCHSSSGHKHALDEVLNDAVRVVGLETIEWCTDLLICSLIGCVIPSCGYKCCRRCQVSRYFFQNAPRGSRSCVLWLQTHYESGRTTGH